MNTSDASLSMSPDEREIRQLVKTWMSATRAGDLETVLGLMADDVVFLQPGRPPMNKAEFAASFPRSPGGDTPVIEGNSEIQEVTVCGDWAFIWTKLSVSITPKPGMPPIVRAGHTLSVLKKERGKWVLARDANLLAPAPEKPAG